MPSVIQAWSAGTLHISLHKIIEYQNKHLVNQSCIKLSILKNIILIEIYFRENKVLWKTEFYRRDEVLQESEFYRWGDQFYKKLNFRFSFQIWCICSWEGNGNGISIEWNIKTIQRSLIYSSEATWRSIAYQIWRTEGLLQLFKCEEVRRGLHLFVSALAWGNVGSLSKNWKCFSCLSIYGLSRLECFMLHLGP